MAYTFISGATGGIGKAFCQKIATSGAEIFITGRSENKLSSLKEELLSLGAKNVEYFACDLTSESSRKEMLDFCDERGIKFDRIINVAGVDIQKGFLKYSEEKLLFQLRVNAEATTVLTHALLRRRADGKTSVITIASMSGAQPMPYFAVYSATKAMLINLFTALHYELKSENVNVTVVMPGGVPTRPDIIEDIKGQGLWGKLSSKPASFIAENALKASRKNKVKCIPGFFNKFMYCLTKIAPRGITQRFICNRWKKQEKDAF